MLKLRTFGGLWVEQDNRPAGAGIGAMRRRALALLALLATAPEQGLSRDKLLPVLWPESDEGKARHVLAQLLYLVRRSLHSDDVILDTGTLRLNPDAMCTDVADFHAALASGDVERAAAIHAAPFLDGFYLAGAAEFERWAESERTRYAALARTALETLATAAAAAGDHRAAATWWRRVVELDPLSSRTTVALMRALVASGDRAAALQQGRVYEALVREELGDVVDPEIQAVTTWIRATASTAGATASAPEPPVTQPLREQRYEEYVGRMLASRYRIERTVGRRSLGTTFQATDIGSGDTVHVRVLLPSLAAIADAASLMNGLHAMARLRHADILPVIDVGQVDDVTFVVTPPPAGESLAARLARHRHLAIHETLRIGAHVADALGYAHEAGMLHLDLTPRRIMLDGDRVTVIDVGVVDAVLGAVPGGGSQTAVTVGAPAFMSPEQLEGGTLDGRADVYSLGCILYQALAGESPHTGPSAQAILARRLTESPRPLRTLRETIPDAVERVVMTALARVPADRFGSMTTMGQALRRAME
ncbi:MAG TPA: protein kinase [Gemmatimonadaceae bacterium]|nr:protein kinase [Gemmatimonadaceae bacterium]